MCGPRCLHIYYKFIDNIHTTEKQIDVHEYSKSVLYYLDLFSLLGSNMRYNMCRENVSKGDFRYTMIEILC